MSEHEAASGGRRGTIAEVIRRLEQDAGLGPIRRRDLVSALNGPCKMLGRDPAAVAADAITLRKEIASISPARVGTTVQTWSNRKACIAAALRQVGITGAPARDVPLSEEWRTLMGRLPTRRLQNGLSRLIRAANAAELRPDQVDDAFFDRFMAEVHQTTLKERPTEVAPILWTAVRLG